MATKTATTDAGATVSGALTLSNQDQRTPGVENHAYTGILYANATDLWCVLQDVTDAYYTWGLYPDASPPVTPNPPWDILIFIRFIGVSYDPAYALTYDYVYLTDALGWSHSADYSISVTGQRVWREESTSYGSGRDGKPVYADDVAYADSWVTVPPASAVVTFGSLSYSGSPNDPGGNPIDAISNAGIVTTALEAAAASYPCEYARGTLKWSNVDVNFSGMSKTYGSGNWKATGSGNAIVFEALQGFDSQDSPYMSAWNHALPRIPRFGGVHVFDRDGVDQNGVRLSGPWRASLEVPDSLNWSTTP